MTHANRTDANGTDANGTGAARLRRLADDLTDARDAFLRALDAVEPDRRTSAGLIGDWGARELVAHLGFWSGRAAEAIHAVETGRAGEFAPVGDRVDELNATVARVARQATLETVRRREEGSFAALLELLRSLDPALLDERLPTEVTLEEQVRIDGPDHYREHAAGLGP